MAGAKGGSGGKCYPNIGPARLRYWSSRSLEKNKVKNLMRHNGMTRAKALAYWREHRKGRCNFVISYS